MENHTFLGRLTDDFKFIEIDPDHLNTRLFRNFDGLLLEIDIKKYEENRSNAQNRYLHGPVLDSIIAFEKERGSDWLNNLTSKESKEAMKAYIYTHVLGQKIKFLVISGREVFVQEGKKFSEMNKTEFNLAVKTLREFYDPLGCHIPEPVKNGFLADYLKPQNKRNV